MICYKGGSAGATSGDKPTIQAEGTFLEAHDS